MERHLWSMKEGGIASGIPTKSMYTLAKDVTIPPGCVVHIGHRLRLIPDRFLAWLEAGGTRPHQVAAPQPGPQVAQPGGDSQAEPTRAEA